MTYYARKLKEVSKIRKEFLTQHLWSVAPESLLELLLSFGGSGSQRAPGRAVI